ncbi:hypothetical protein F2Q70_00036602 [Brassica cretica]|uniref:Uncharacterized protein n=1 Tax=Brassica cretica TaxID=69181 RepID=A0A8S9JUD7_BRACR|nr:hypothetical protein F2Q70_00036602 [Brassica cretica]
MIKLKHLKTSRTIYGPPIGALVNHQREEPFKSRFDDSINAVSFDFVGTYILISMLLDTDIFEKLTGTTTNPDSSSDRILLGVASRVGFSGAASKLGYRSPKASTLLVAFCLLSYVKC